MDQAQSKETIQSLATKTAELARASGVRPNVVVRAVCREYGVPEAVSTDILRECGRRGGKSKHGRKKISEKTKRAILAEYRQFEIDLEMHQRAIQANEHICPIG